MGQGVKRKVFPDVEPGTRKKKSLPITRPDNNRPILLPVYIIRGSRDGPTLLVNSGVHGDEERAIETVQKALKEVDPSRLCGTLLAVPAVNVTAHKSGSRSAPEDGLNMNRVFPGDPTGSLTERIAHSFFNKIVLNADYVIGLHTATPPEAFIPHARIRGSDPSGRAWKMVCAFGVELVWDRPGHPGMLQVQALEHQIPAVTIELGGDNDTAQGVSGIMNVMKHLGMMEGDYQVPDRLIRLSGQRLSVASPIEGVFEGYAGLGSTVTEGSYIGRVSNPEGDESADVLSPANGMVAGLSTAARVSKGDRLFFILECMQDKGGGLSPEQIVPAPKLQNALPKENSLLSKIMEKEC